jgi:hypothetical protein
MRESSDICRFAAEISGRMVNNIEKGFALANRRPTADDQTNI